MQLLRFTVALALVLPALAGCLAPIDSAALDDAAGSTPAAFTPPPAPDFDFSTVVDPDHGGHVVGALHAVGHGLGLVGHAGVGSILPPGMQGSITQVDVWGDYALVSGMQGELGFVIVDISDPKAPTPVSYYADVSDGWTARFSDDGNFVFLGCQILTGFSPYGAVKGNCEDPDAVHAPSNPVTGSGAPAGVVVVDVADKAKPQFVHFLAAGGSHNLQVAAIGGVDYVFTSSTAILKFDREARELELVAEVPGVHDATVQQHPKTGDWLLYTGAAGGSFAIYDVNDPASPQVVYEGGLEGVVGWHEQTPIPALIDGRALLVLAGETFLGGAAQPMDAVFVVDVTDPANPVKLSEWVPPFAPQVPWASYMYSVHEIAATPTGQVAIAWYHAGAWVLDVSTQERMHAPVVLAAYQPNKDVNVVPSTFAQTAVPVVPFVWGAGWDDRGYLVVPDMHTGVYVLEPEWGLAAGVDGGQ